ncbi:MAG: hypothetical protein AAF334_11630 [Pseudomonadota bacterium]
MVDRASPFAETVDAENAGIVLAEDPRGALWQVACWPEAFTSVEAALADACGCSVPQPGQMIATPDGGLLFRVEPLKWWFMAASGAACPHQPAADQGAWLDMAHDQASISVTGAHAAELLKRMVSIDLRETGFPDMSYASTTVHHMFLKVLRRDRVGVPSYSLMVMRSYADDLREILTHHLEHFEAE